MGRGRRRPRTLICKSKAPARGSTPTYHQGKLYCLFARGELLCLSADGKVVWERNIFKDTGAAESLQKYFYWGVAASPLVEGNLLIVQPGGASNNSVVAFDKDTGKVAWGAGSDPIGYSSPIAITCQGVRQVICPTGTSYLGVNPADGKILWRYPFGNQFRTNCANPVWADETLFVSAAYGMGSAALSLEKEPEGGWHVKEKWRQQEVHAKPVRHQHYP